MGKCFNLRHLILALVALASVACKNQIQGYLGNSSAPVVATKISVESAADGTGVEYSTLMLEAHASTPFYAVKRTADGQFLTNERVTWGLSGAIGTLTILNEGRSATFNAGLVLTTGKIFIEVNSEPVYEVDVTIVPPAFALPPTALENADPATNAGTDDTPQFRILGLVPGDVVRLYSDAGCTTEVANGTASGSTLLLTLSSSLTVEGVYTYFANRQDIFSNTSACSAANVSYTYDVTPPPDPLAGDVSLYSALMAGKNTSLTYSPDVKVLYSGVDNLSGVTGFDYRIVRVLDDSVERDWTYSGAAHFRASGLSMLDNEDYRVDIRAVDAAGNRSGALIDLTNTVFNNQLLAAGPYDGLGLPDVSTLADDSVSGTIDANTFSRATPKSANKLTVTAALSWAATKAALFLRSSEIIFPSMFEVSASGTNASGTAGGSGGSGGGSGSIYYNVSRGGDGGSNGADGGDAPSTSGAPGTGTGSAFFAGFNYGVGGKGGNGGNYAAGVYGDLGGLGGTGGNAVGGGGGGAGPDMCCGSGKGGGGGGGLVVLVTDKVTGAGRLVAEGGHGVVSAAKGRAGGGGGGVIWVQAREYQGNLDTSVQGGYGHEHGLPGTARIFQTNADGTLTERRFADAWAADGVAAVSQLPFAQNLPDAGTLSDAILTNPVALDGRTFNRVSPFQARLIELTGTWTWDTAGPATLFVYADTLRFMAGATISANGQAGTANSGSYVSGVGGKGGSGGGNGNYGGGFAGNGGSAGGHGYMTMNTAGDYGAGSTVGLGSAGFIQHFNFGTGGNGGNGINFVAGVSGLGGSGGNGVGGGGGGGHPQVCCTVGAGGGGGGGLVAIVANRIEGAGSLSARGANATNAGGGGGGVIWVATQSYDGQLTIDVSGGTSVSGTAGTSGTARIFKINNDGSLTEKLFTDNW